MERLVKSVHSTGNSVRGRPRSNYIGRLLVGPVVARNQFSIEKAGKSL